MITLKESILSSTKTGKAGLRNKIEEWCKENILSSNYVINNKFEIEPDIENGGKYDSFRISRKAEFPDYIKFGSNFENCNFYITPGMKDMDSSRFPKECRSLSIDRFTEKLPSLKMRLHNIIIDDLSGDLSKISKDCEFEFWSKPGGTWTALNAYISFRDTRVGLSELKNIKCTGDLKKLALIDTPAAKELIEGIKKAKRLEKKTNQDEVTKYINTELSNFGTFERLELSNRIIYVLYTNSSNGVSKWKTL